jgi:O-antigen/teichoic acid export membrane protein
MNKTFFSNLLLLLTLNLLIKPFFILGIDAEVQNQVGAAEYGDYFALLNFSFLFTILLDFGITNYNTRNIARHPHVVKRYFGPIIGLRTILFVIYAFFTLGFGLLISYSDKQLYLLSILILNQFFVAVIHYLRSNFAGLHLFKVDAFFSVLDRGLLILFCSYLLWWRKSDSNLQIEWFVWAQTAAYGFSALLAILVTIAKVGKLNMRFNGLFSMVILRQSFPYALLILLMMIYNRMDSVMLERIHPQGATEAGIYAQGYRLLDAVNMFALLFAGLLLPLFSRMIAKKESISSLLTNAGSVLMSIALIVSLTGYFYSETLMHARYLTHVEESAHVFKLLILSFIPVSATYLYGSLLTANGSLRQLNQMAGFGLLVNFGLNYLLIPVYGAWGAAVATLITQLFTAGFQLILAYRLLPLRMDRNALMRFGVFSAACFGFLATLTSTLQGLSGFIIAGSVCLGFALITGSIRIKEALKLVVRKQEPVS